MKGKKVIVGITAPPSVDLLIGQLRYFQQVGYEVYLLAPDDPRVTEYCQREGVPHLKVNIERNISPVKDFFTILSLIKMFKREKPDIINLGTPKISLVGMIAGYVTGVPVRIYTCRGLRFERESGTLRRVLMVMEKVTARCAHKVFCISKSLRDFGVEQGIFPLEKTRLIGHGSSNGVDLSQFSRSSVSNEELDQVRKEYDLSGKFVFGFVGRLTDMKGIQELFDAFVPLYEKHKEVRLLVVGRPIWDHIRDRAIIEKMNDHPGITMAGFQVIEKIPVFLKAMDCFVLPTWGEGFGNVYIQAASMGVPIIGTDVTGCRDAVSHGYNGVLVPNKNVDELRKAMEDLYLNEEKRKRMGSNGVAWSKNFEPHTIWKGYQQLYEEKI